MSKALIAAIERTIYGDARKNVLAEGRALAQDRELFLRHTTDNRLSKEFARAYDAGVVAAKLGLSMEAAFAVVDKPQGECTDAEKKERANARKRRSDRVKLFGVLPAHAQGGKAPKAEAPAPVTESPEADSPEADAPAAPAPRAPRQPKGLYLPNDAAWSAFIVNMQTALEAAVEANPDSFLAKGSRVPEAVAALRDALTEAHGLLVNH